MIDSKIIPTACAFPLARHAGQIVRFDKPCLRAQSRPWQFHVSAASSTSSGGGPPKPPAPLRAVAADDGEPGRWRRWLLPGVVIFVVGGTVLLVFIAAQENAASWKEDTENASLSIIVPALNEEAGIRACIEHLQSLDPPPHQIIIADGGSSDRTVEIAQELGVEVVRCGKGRATQMNAGAKHATSQLLCFVHADNLPPPSLVRCARETLSDGRTVVGGFRVVVRHQGRTLRWMTLHQRIKTYYAPLLFRPLSYARGLRAMFGDQNLFCRRADFEGVGGYDQRLPIMEDLDLIMRMHTAGPRLPHPEADKEAAAASASTSGSPTSTSEPATLKAPLPAGAMPFSPRKPMAALAPIRLRDEDKMRLGRAEAMKELGSKYGAAGTLNQPPPNLQELMAAQSGWSGPRQPSGRPAHHFGGSQPGEATSHRDASACGAAEPCTAGKAAGGEGTGVQGLQPLRRSKFGRRKGAKCRGRIRMVLDPPAVTSGRRLAAWGNLKGTWIHFRLATHWYFGGSVEELHKLYHRIYTDDYR